jgi:ubiquinone/menaquinone biosynthesis C-methylase UbiE
MSKYQSEFNKLLNRNIYYTPQKFPNPVNYFNEESLPVKIIIENQLWKHPNAINEMLEYYIQTGLNYKLLNVFYLHLVKKYNIENKLSVERGDNRISSIKKYIRTNFSVSCYLDIGCFDGAITESIGKYFKLNKLQTHGVDINEYNTQQKEYVFTQYDGKILPYSDNSFNLITCMMVLHHIKDDNLDKLLQEINRVMKPNGILILREHDVELSESVSKSHTLNIMHDFYDYVWTDSPINQEDQWCASYKSNKDWTNLFSQNGFMLRATPNIHKGDKNPFFTYYTSYIKSKSTDKTQLYRILPTEMKRTKYHNRTNEIKPVIHWGQRKLLMSEIEFLTVYLQEIKNIQSKPIYVIYAGSAPGTHILYLSKLFPTVHFELYDPREFSKKLNGCNRIKTHVQYFMDETANEWKSENHPDKIILFISDIRTGDTDTMTSKKVEERVKIDNQWQINWYNIMSPKFSMFKFRLPYDSDEKTEYLAGLLYLGVYATANSTETRLIVKDNAKMKTYDNREFEEQLCHFNNHERILNYDNLLYDIGINKKHGIKNNYDGASEVYILKEYVKLNQNKNTPDKILQDIVISMIGEISKELSYSRTLFSEQPVKTNKKNIMVKLQRDGFIPSGIELNQNTFDTYIIPKYSYFEINGYFKK